MRNSTSSLVALRRRRTSSGSVDGAKRPDHAPARFGNRLRHDQAEHLVEFQRSKVAAAHRGIAWLGLGEKTNIAGIEVILAFSTLHKTGILP